MKNPIYKLVEITGTSENGSDEAAVNAIERAKATIKNLRWFQILETRGNIDNGRIHHWQVTIKVGFEIQEAT
ncbi:MAG: dodecin family protein [Nibricoccus sp.]